MDLTFVEVFAKEGLDAPAASFARAFADAPYPLWHANQMARYNILRGIMPPLSGDWRNNPHADDIDFQIEADFAGLMSPGLPGAAAAISRPDRPHHELRRRLVRRRLYRHDVRPGLHPRRHRADRRRSPQGDPGRDVLRPDHGRRHPLAPRGSGRLEVGLVQGPADLGRGCRLPEGVFSSFDIDAKINCAWVLIGLLYGDGDFGKTLSISQRCGDDSDCNPASAGGILGTMLGYRNIPATWTGGLAAIEDRPFPYTTISLADAASLSYEQALENIRRHGGSVDADRITIAAQAVSPVALEIGFEGHRPVERRTLGLDLGNEGSFRFTGIGFAVNGEAVSTDRRKHVFRAEMLIDGKSAGIIELPTDSRLRNPTPFWAYGLAAGPHEVIFRILNPAEGARLRLQDAVIYAEAKK